MSARSALPRDDRRPVLVTGMPRSGTTWLARLLARAEHASLPGREPMNARGKQYALAGTLDGWTRLTSPTPKQRRALRLAYRGLSPRVLSRYGLRQWASLLPSTRVVVKDPFALLSIPAIMDTTGARAVLVYRHPAAVLASYRRMGWHPDPEEFRAVVETARRDGVEVDRIPEAGSASEAEMFAGVWSCLHQIALSDTRGRDVLVVSHSELATGGVPAGQALAAALSLTWTDAMAKDLARESTGSAHPAGTASLHNLERSPAEVAEAWRTQLSSVDLNVCEALTEGVRAALDSRRVTLG